jgi:CRISPR-associated exonuclease Cas4
MISPDELAPLSALEHLVYCERQAALIHLEGVWEENLQTAQGRLLHESAHGDKAREKDGVRIVRGLWLRSERLGLVGRADVVEFRPRPPGPEAVYPVEYKRGRLRSERAYQVQLCAQALCLEEMLGREVAAGAVYFGQPRRRLEVVMDPDLRRATEAAAERLHALLQGGRTPPARPDERCRACSLEPRCLPRSTDGRRSARRYLLAGLAAACQEEV